MNLSVRPQFKLFLTLGLVLAVYFQSIHNPFSRFDDPFIVEYYGLNSTVSLYDIFTPGNSFYYRPLINLSYWLDNRLWGMDPTFMHLENIVFHLVNVLLVFLITTRLPTSSNNQNLPYLSALLFGLHPLHSEPVNWIAGRTDIVAGVFILLSFYCLVRALENASTRWAGIAFVSVLLGVLTKETSIMFIPLACIVALRWPVSSQQGPRYTNWRNRYILLPLSISTVLVTALLLLVYIKRRGDNAISLLFNSSGDFVLHMNTALGFYVKKLFLPLPLNIAITEVHPLYAIAGIVAVCGVVVAFCRHRVLGIFLAAAVLFIVPALIVAISGFAWTPYGERYLYIPVAFVVVGCLDYSYQLLTRLGFRRLFPTIICLVLVISSIVTFHRCRVWGDNLTLIEDVVEKSPDFGVARNEYGILLKMAGRYEEATKQFEIAARMTNKEYVARMIRLNLVGMKLVGKNAAEARDILLVEIGGKADADIELLKLLNKNNEQILHSSVHLRDKDEKITEILAVNDRLYTMTGDMQYPYRSGQLALSAGKKTKAAEYFKMVVKNSAPGSFYYKPASNLVEKLCKE